MASIAQAKIRTFSNKTLQGARARARLPSLRAPPAAQLPLHLAAPRSPVPRAVTRLRARTHAPPRSGAARLACAGDVCRSGLARPRGRVGHGMEGMGALAKRGPRDFWRGLTGLLRRLGR